MNKGNKTKAFRSSSDVSNYNKLLTELDNNQTNLNNDTKEDDKMDNYLKTLNKVYDLYNSSPINQTTNKESNDPNAYMTLEANKHKIEFLYQRQRKLEYQQRLDEEKKKEESVEIERKNNRKKVNIQFEINNIGDLLRMIEQYPDDKDIEYNIDIHSLNKIKGPLEDKRYSFMLENLQASIIEAHKYNNKEEAIRFIMSFGDIHLKSGTDLTSVTTNNRHVQ